MLVLIGALLLHLPYLIDAKLNCNICFNNDIISEADKLRCEADNFQRFRKIGPRFK